MGERAVQRARSDFQGCPGDPKEVRLRNAPGLLCTRGRAPVRVKGFTHPKIFTYTHRVKGKGKHPTTL